MDRADPTRNGYLGGLEDGVGRWGELGPDPVFRFPGFQMNHPDFGEVLQHRAGRQLFEFLRPTNDPKKTADRDVVTPGLTGLPSIPRNPTSIARWLSSASSPPTT